jgi:hypothetical protein
MSKTEPAEVIEIPTEIDGAAPQTAEVHEPVIDGTEEPVGGTPVVDETEELKKRLEAAERRATDAEARANSLHTEKTASETRLASEVNSRFAAQEQAIDARSNAAKTALTTLKAEIARASSENRYEDVADLSEKLADAKLEERSAAWEKGQITQFKARAQQEAEAASTRSQNPTDAFLATIPGDRSRQWLRNHPDILKNAATSEQGRALLFGAAQTAQGKGHTPDSDDYFTSIETQLGLREPEATVTAPAPAAKAAPKAPGQTASAAPSGRTASQTGTSRTVTLDDVVKKLNPNDRANAKISFPDKPEDEALKLFAQGLVISKQREPSFRPDIRL